MRKMVQSHSNPFDFEKPVKDLSLFAGRKEELEEIKYYLDLMTGEKPSYHNLSIIGHRAAGKTSMLNMIQHITETKGLLAVKISLNNQTSENEILLFKEIFDGIMTAGAEKGMFGGITGNIYKLFRKVIDTLDMEAEIPLLYGTAYIGTKKHGDTSISQQVLIHDLKKLFEEAKDNKINGIVLLFDECDLLGQNQTLLQKIRNVINEVNGYTFIFSGTEKMFPVMDDTFSPLPRSFKRINIENFKKPEETKECIINRLSENEKKLISDATISEIHSITNGSPYEVQLISHFMYKQYQEKKSTNIAINTAVLDDLMNELDRLRKDSHHITNQIKQCHNQELNILCGIMEFPRATKDQISTVMVLSEIDVLDIKDLNSKKSEYKLILSSMNENLLKEENGKLQIAGDSFDLLYLKYYLASNGIMLRSIGIPNEEDINLSNKLTDILFRDIPSYISQTRFDKILQEKDGQRGQRLIFGGKFAPKPSATPGEWVTLFTFSPDEYQKKFYLGTENSIRFRVNVKFLNTGFVTQCIFIDGDQMSKAEKRIKSLMPKLDLLGIQLIMNDEIALTLEGVNLTNMKKYDKAMDLYDKALKMNPEYELAWMNKGQNYLLMELYSDALKCFQHYNTISPRYALAWEGQGKCYIHLMKFNESLSCFDKAIEYSPDTWSIWDNRGRALLKLERFEEAVDSFDKAINLKSDDYEAIFLKGICLSELDRDKEALQNFEICLQNDPQNVVVLINKARSLHNVGQGKEALLIIEKLEPEIKDVAVLMSEKSIILGGLGKYSEAIECCNKILDLNPDDFLAFYNRACFRTKEGDVENALLDLKKAIEQGGNSYVEMAKKEGDFESIKNDARFLALIG